MKFRAGMASVIFLLVVGTSACTVTKPYSIKLWGPSQKEMALREQLKQTKDSLAAREQELTAKRKALKETLNGATKRERRTRIFKEVEGIVEGKR
jgi:cytochrome c biogenesis protein ResB